MRGPLASGGGEAVEEDESPHIVDEIGHADLYRGAGDSHSSDEELHLVLLNREEMLNAGADFGFDRLVRRVVSGIGRPRGFLRWTRLRKPFFSKNSSFAFEQ